MVKCAAGVEGVKKQAADAGLVIRHEGDEGG